MGPAKIHMQSTWPCFGSSYGDCRLLTSLDPRACPTRRCVVGPKRQSQSASCLAVCIRFHVATLRDSTESSASDTAVSRQSRQTLTTCKARSGESGLLQKAGSPAFFPAFHAFWRLEKPRRPRAALPFLIVTTKNEQDLHSTILKSLFLFLLQNSPQQLPCSALR